MRLHLFLIFGLMCMAPYAATAGKLYQWKDASGHVHFTDDQSQVPQQHLKGSARDVKPLATMSNPEETAAGKKYIDGKALYESQCAECHVPGFDDEGRREGLGWTVINIDTKYPNTEDDLFNRLRYVVDGGIDMPIVKISDDELRAIARYLIKTSSPKH